MNFGPEYTKINTAFSGGEMGDLWVSQEHATFLLVVEKGIVVDAPPIARWTLGKDAKWLKAYYRLRNAQVREIEKEQGR